MIKARWLTIGLATILATLALMPTAASTARPRLISSSDRGWICTIAGGIVGFGVGAATAEVTGGLALVGFTAGCELSQNRKPPTKVIGLPRPDTYGKGCFYYWWRGHLGRRWRNLHCHSYYA